MIDLSRQDDIAILRMAHGKANTLDVEFCDALAGAFGELRNSEARAAIIVGTGNIFSAGVDLLRVSADGEAYVRRFLPALHRMFDAAFNLPKPLIAAVNGHAIAGGCVLACCADVRIAARGQGRIGVTELLVGVPFPALAFEVMRFAANRQYLPDIMLTGATWLSDDARQRGLVDEVVEPAELMNRSLAAAKGLANLSPAAFATTKEQLRQPVADRMAQHAVRVDKRVEEIWTSPDTIRHIRDYVAKTFKKG
ncbi:enoyl-CoA hydratase/isomerase family protein [Bradyrhizobium sp. LHD-71]|uniref:enoyl-CoA hydratase/isomerase family protein n=1 Tax=Bradyrhizobium sp. LHD-71 TaxID=3072141 RepID=UPI00280EBAF5|nr:enoyl-CoA hydratase/isomerase family protein [Bradyrhizobium sp. LHD-71]MDQ8726109.1 enoyl-CoA hydratase/isomerase family protein [Bradyrhizobium sp. LHD-71]